MPRNRADQDRDGKREAIIRSATALFAERGFEGTSMAAIAAEAEITKNTVYWYFADKDALLLSVLSRAFRAARTRWDDGGPDDLASRLALLVETFAAVSPLTTSLHTRVRASEAVREWHERFHSSGERWLEEELAAHLTRRGLPQAQASTVTGTVRLWSFAIEGMVAHGYGAPERRALCELLVSQVEATALAEHDAVARS